MKSSAKIEKVPKRAASSHSPPLPLRGKARVGQLSSSSPNRRNPVAKQSLKRKKGKRLARDLRVEVSSFEA